MRSVVGLALLSVVMVSVGASAQCGCGVPEAPNCYMTFQSNETIEFTLIAPVDYFTVHCTTVSPSIWGWRVEAADGTIVRTVLFEDGPISRRIPMEWDLYDDAGYLVDPGFYTIILMSTDGEVTYPVRILERCRPCCGCWCWWTAPLACDVPCCIPFGELYLSLAVGETRSCFGLSFSLHFRFECTGP